MLNRSIRCGGRAGADHLVRIGEERRYGKSGGIGGSHALWGEGVGSNVGPEGIGGVSPGTVFIDALPHFVESRIVAASCLEIDEDVPVVCRVTGAFYRGVGGNWAGGEVGLIDGGRD